MAADRLMTGKHTKSVLWWGRFDPDYSRNRIIRQTFQSLGWKIEDYRPHISPLGHWQASLSGIKSPDLLWLPAFRQRDATAAIKWAKARHIPVIFDPLISAYDKQVYERQKFSAETPQAQRLLAWEKAILSSVDYVIADTQGHAEFFERNFNLPKEKLAVIPVSAEEALFTPALLQPKKGKLEALFFGSFIGLQAPDVIVEAAKLCGAPIHWTLLGSGPELSRCERLAAGYPSISFEAYLPYEQLPARIHKADILLGIFGTSDKAARVIPNKVYQALACGRPVITRVSDAYSDRESINEKGVVQISPGDPLALAEAISQIYDDRDDLQLMAQAARRYYDTNFSLKTVMTSLTATLDKL
jgi:glycosyltransferase involved in cell wall biosynthesis